MSIGKDFIENTKYQNLSISQQKQGKKQPPLELPVKEGVMLIDLPDPHLIKIRKIDFIQLVEDRKTHRKYSEHYIIL